MDRSVSITSRLILGDHQIIDKNTIFRQHHHVFAIKPTVHFLGLVAPTGSKRLIELYEKAPNAKRQLDKIVNLFTSETSFNDASAFCVAAELNRNAFDDRDVTVTADYIRDVFADNFGRDTALDISEKTKQAFAEYQQALPDYREKALRNTQFAY